MSLALVREALEFVDQEENKVNGRRKKRHATRQPQTSSQEYRHRYKSKRLQKNREETKSKEQVIEEKIKKLLALSKPVADDTIAGKIVERAIKGKPLADKIEVKTEEEKSILFPEESFEDFEKEYFCS